VRRLDAAFTAACISEDEKSAVKPAHSKIGVSPVTISILMSTEHGD